MSVVSFKFTNVVAICDFEYSKFVDELGEHVKCELSLSRNVDPDLFRRVVNYLARLYGRDVDRHVMFSVGENVELKIYSDVLKYGLSFYDIVEKFCLLLDFLLWIESSNR